MPSVTVSGSSLFSGKDGNLLVVAILDFGLGGYYDSNCRLSGYDRPENWKPHADSDYSRAIVINKRNVLDKRPGLAISMPMCNPDVKGDDVDRCPQPSETMIAGLQGEFKTLAKLRSQRESYGGLDYVSPETYARLWKEHGARIGKVVNNVIVWES